MDDEAFLLALGELTREASALEYSVTYLVHARGLKPEEMGRILGRPGHPRQELRRLSEELGALHKDLQLAGEVQKLYLDCRLPNYLA